MTPTLREAERALTCHCGKRLVYTHLYQGGRGYVGRYECPSWIYDGEEGHDHLEQTQYLYDCMTELIHARRGS